MAVMWKYDIVVLDATDSKSRAETMIELGRGGWELVGVLPGDWMAGDPSAAKMSWFVKREATHDISF